MWLSLGGFLEAFGEAGVAAGGFVVLDGAGEGAFVADEQAEVAGASQAGVEQVALQHHILAGVQDEHDGTILRSLALVDAESVGELQFVVVGVVVLDDGLRILDEQDLIVGFDVEDRADVAVEDVLVVVVDKLDHAVANAEAAGTAQQFRATSGGIGGIERLLQQFVQIVHAQGAASHGGEDLDGVAAIAERG